MPIEELLALYNCVPPPIPTTSLSSESTSKRSSRRARSSSAIQSENTPSVPDVLPPTTAIESASCSEHKSDASNKSISAGSDAFVSDAKDTEQQQLNVDKAIRTSEKIDTHKLNATSIETKIEETEMKMESDKIEAVAKIESKSTESVKLNRENEFTEMDEDDDDDDEEDESELRKLYPETFKTNEPRLLRGKYSTAASCITNNIQLRIQLIHS